MSATIATSANNVENSSDLHHQFNDINYKLRRHNDGEEPLPDDVYKSLLRQSLDICTKLNISTAGPKQAKQPKVRKLAAAKANPDSLDDL